MRLEQQYAQYSDEGLLEAAELGREEFQEGVYDIILAEVKRRRLEEQLDEKVESRRRTNEIQEDGLDIVLLRRFTFVQEAEFAKNLLEENDIQSVIMMDDYGTAPSAVAFGIQQAKLLVLEDDFEMADEILKTMEDEE
jgi:hypothetical protein